MTILSGPPDGALPADEPRDDDHDPAGLPDSLAFDISSSDATAHVRLTGAIADSTAIELSNVLGGLIRGGHRRLTVDLGQLRRTSCVATGVLNRAAAELRAVHGALTLINVPDETVALLRRAGLSREIVVNAVLETD